ncbi:hypothetical protein [Dongia sp.]|uniref:hypothetical protein n=1 Tax=Dongia sp. TaxID=1977262 RepID=UPI0035B26792
MTTARAEISLADLLRAIAVIRPENDAETRAIAALLGFDPAIPGAEMATRSAAVPDLPKDSPFPRHTQPVPLPPPVTPPTPPDPDSTGGSIRISERRRSSRSAPAWLANTAAMKSGALREAHAPAPLFQPRWVRALLGASLAARRPIGPPDLTRAVETLARGEALRVLPRQPILTMAAGVQVMIDIGERMQPFWHDRANLIRDLRRVVGSDSIDFLQCKGTPERTRRNDAEDWEAYLTQQPPRFGACMLIVSDFGLGAISDAHGASPHTWIAFARQLARRGHRVVGFVPFPPARWPDSLARAIDLVAWDRGSTVGRISAMRRAEEAT